MGWFTSSWDISCVNLDVSKNRATPKWMVYNGKTLLKWMIWGVFPLFLETSIGAASFGISESHSHSPLGGPLANRNLVKSQGGTRSGHGKLKVTHHKGFAIKKWFVIWVFPKIGVHTPKSSIFIGFSIRNHPFCGIPIFGNAHIVEINSIHYHRQERFTRLNCDWVQKHKKKKNLGISQISVKPEEWRHEKIKLWLKA